MLAGLDRLRPHTIGRRCFSKGVRTSLTTNFHVIGSFDTKLRTFFMFPLSIAARKDNTKNSSEIEQTGGNKILSIVPAKSHIRCWKDIRVL